MCCSRVRRAIADACVGQSRSCVRKRATSHLLLLPVLAAGLLILLLLAALPAARTVAASEPAEALR